MARAVVIGAGIAGASCARALSSAGVDVALIDRARAPGGRLASPRIQQRRVDIGAAYFTVQDEEFAALVEDWRSRGIARQWTDTLDVAGPEGLRAPTTGPQRWAAPGGLRSLVRDLIDGLDVELGRTVGAVHVEPGGPSVDGERADAVVLAMPDPQAARLLDAPPFDPVAYDPVISVIAGWAARDWPIRDAVFVNDHPDITIVADDGSRRGDAAAVLVAHSSTALATRHLGDPDGAVAPVVAATRAVLGIRTQPEWTRAHRWTFAKPATTHDASYLLTDRMVGLAGDSWCPSGSPRTEAAWLSGQRLGRELARRLR